MAPSLVARPPQPVDRRLAVPLRQVEQEQADRPLRLVARERPRVAP
jgi:hypothetical protein